MPRLRAQPALRLARSARRRADWIGYLIIDVLRLDRDNQAAQHKAKELFKTWHKSRMFKVVTKPDDKRTKREFVEVDQPAD